MTEEKKSSEKEEKKSDTVEAKTDKKVAVPAKFKGIIEEIEKMSVLDLAELVTILEDKFNVSAAAPVAMAAAPVAGAADGGEGEAEEKSEYDIEITSAGESKIAVIKVVKEITEKGLKDAKDLVDAAPKVIKEKVAKEEAGELKKKLEEAGATVELK
jgi:large subunit ribosomal protein L7/L12